ncbi:MFS transporter [Clavibacter sp. Sh2036]|uniref:MFS transporter n=1 Tax=Clavibacter sp. Sh2036 TaxID=3397677 RepID=UPI0039E10892
MRAAAPPTTTWGLLRHNVDYRRVFFAQVICQGGDWFTMIPLILLMQRLTGSGALGAVLLSVETFVIAGLSLVAGSLLDRFDRRKILIVCLLGSSLAIGLLFLISSAATALLGVATYALLAVGKAFFTPAVNTIVPDLVERHGLLAATTGLGSVWGVMLVLGSTLGGLVSSFASPYVCFGVTFLGYLIAGLSLLRLPKLGRAATDVPRLRLSAFVSDSRSVFRAAKTSRMIGALILAKPGTNIGNGILAVFPSIALMLSSGEPALMASFLFAARGIGALIGPMLARPIVRAGIQPRRALLATITLFGVAYALMAMQTSAPLAIILVIVAHIGGSATASLSNYGLQQESPAALRGRIFAFDNMFSMLAIGISQLVAAVLIGVLPAPTLVQLFGGITVVYGIVWFLCSRRAESEGGVRGAEPDLPRSRPRPA